MKTALLAFAFLAAQGPVDEAPVVDASAETVDHDHPGAAVITDDFTGVAQATKEIVDVAANYKAVGGLAVAAAIIGLLVQLLKLGAIGRWFEARGLRWARLFLGVIVAGGVAAIGAAQLGEPVVPAFTSGLLAALTASGGHDLLRMAFSAEARGEKRVSGSSLLELLRVAEETAVAAGVPEADIIAAAALPVSQRMARLADLLSTKKASA